VPSGISLHFLFLVRFPLPRVHLSTLTLAFISWVVLWTTQSWRLCQSTLSPVFVTPFQRSSSAVVSGSVCSCWRCSTANAEESPAFVGSVRCHLCRSHPHCIGFPGCPSPTNFLAYQRLDHHGRGCAGVGGYRRRPSRLAVSLLLA
jgi:hypothetical protein